MTEQRPAHAHCGSCGEQWVFAYVPMPLADFARLAKAAACPRGCKSAVYLGELVG